jgi:nucleoid DNA-binding protein
MTKSALVAQVMEQAPELTELFASRMVDTVLEGMARVLIRNGGLMFRGFGTFDTFDVPAHSGRNPQTGEAVDVPANVRVSFRAADALRDRIMDARAARARPRPRRSAA